MKSLKTKSEEKKMSETGQKEQGHSSVAPRLSLSLSLRRGERAYMVAECRLDSLMSCVVFLEGDRSSTGEMKPSASSSSWSRKPSMLRLGRSDAGNEGLESPSSSEPSSSSW